MKLLFSYVGPLIKDAEGNYYSRTIKDEMLSRYFGIADEITMCTRVKIVLNKEELKRYTKINSGNFKVIECPNMFSTKGILLKNKAMRILKEAIENADIVFVRLPCALGNLAVKIAKDLKKHYLIEVVGCPRDSMWNHSLKGKFVAPYIYNKTRKNIKSSPFTLYVTNEFLQKRYPCNGKTIGCSDVVLPQLNDNILKKRLDKINNINDKNPIIIGTTAAANVRYKGQEYVISAISKLNKEGYNFEYHLAGDGDSSYLKSVAEKYNVIDKVKFLGALPHDRIFDYLDSIDVYIQPSKVEGLPRALVEAMSRGCPSIGSKIGGIPELLNDKFLFSKGSVREICELLKMMDKKTMSREANRSFQKAKEFDKNLLDEKRIGFYKEFVEMGVNK